MFKVSEPQEENFGWLELKKNEKKCMEQLNRRAKTVHCVG